MSAGRGPGPPSAPLVAAIITVLAVPGAAQPVPSSSRPSRVGRVLLVANVVYITGLACASGGLLGSASVLLAVNVLFASLLFSALVAAAVRRCCSP